MNTIKNIIRKIILLNICFITSFQPRSRRHNRTTSRFDRALLVSTVIKFFPALLSSIFVGDFVVIKSA
jgi:hypothetical protein